MIEKWDKSISKLFTRTENLFPLVVKYFKKIFQNSVKFFNSPSGRISKFNGVFQNFFKIFYNHGNRYSVNVKKFCEGLNVDFSKKPLVGPKFRLS